MHHYVISLPTAERRREHMRAQFAQQGIAFQFVDAVTPKTAPAVAHALGITLYEPAPFSAVEIACLLSHVQLWKRIAEGHEAYAAIYEDDINLSPDFHTVIARVEQSALLPFAALKLETVFQRNIITTRPNAWFGNFALARLKSSHLGTAAYILTRETAKALWQAVVRDSAQRHTTTPDNLLFREKLWHLNVQQLIPAIAYQDSTTANARMPSTLEQERAQHQQQRRQQRNWRSFLRKTWHKRHRYPWSFWWHYGWGGRVKHAFIPMHQRPDLPQNPTQGGYHHSVESSSQTPS